MTARRRILFLAEGATMAHFARPLALADSLDPAEYEVHFHAPERFSRYLGGKPFTSGTLASMPGEQFLDNIAHGRPLFPGEVLRRYVNEERELLRSLRPDLAIGDMRLSLPISARLEGVRCAVMINAYWSPWARKRSVMPELPLSRLIPPRLLAPLYRLTEPLAFGLHVAHMNRVRREFGIPPLPLDMRKMYTDGDYVLYPDVPDFIPTPGAPASHRYVGVCDWAPPVSTPEWWNAMREDPRKKVFVSLGSSGPVRVLPQVLDALEELPVSVILSTSGRAIADADRVKYRAELLPFTATAALSSVVISHGGSGGLYPALAAGTPVLGIPSNADQQISTAVLEESGAGLGVRVEEAGRRRLRNALEKLLFHEGFAKAAGHWKDIFAAYDSTQHLRNFLRDILPAPDPR